MSAVQPVLRLPWLTSVILVNQPSLPIPARRRVTKWNKTQRQIDGFYDRFPGTKMSKAKGEKSPTNEELHTLHVPLMRPAKFIILNAKSHRTDTIVELCPAITWRNLSRLEFIPGDLVQVVAGDCDSDASQKIPDFTPKK